MSKRGYLTRYLHIVKQIQATPYCTFEDLNKSVLRLLNNLLVFDNDLEIGFSKRTLQRDIREIKNIFRIEIVYSKSRNGYYIEQTLCEQSNLAFREMLGTMSFLDALNLAEDFKPYVFFDTRKSLGMELFHDIFLALKNKCEIEFNYQKFGSPDIVRVKVAPCALKEFRHRWYLFGINVSNGEMRCYGTDRITNLDITKNAIDPHNNRNMETYFANSFGIVVPKNDEPEVVILQLTGEHSHYVTTLPLHSSQEVLSETEHGTIVRLRINITYDFVFELLSMGIGVKVIAPKSLCDELVKIYRTTIGFY